MNITAFITGLATIIIGIFALLLKNEKNKRQKVEQKAEELKTEVKTKEVEQAAAKVSDKVEVVNNELTKEIYEKTEQALKEIHKSLQEDQAKIYNEKVKGWKKVKR